MKFSLGLIIGALAASAVWYFSLTYSTDTPAQAGDDTSQSTARALPEPALLPQPFAETSTTSDAPELTANATDAAYPAPTAPPQSASPDSQAAHSSDNAGLPIQSSHEHAELIQQTTERKTVAQLHRDLELEERDAAWAPNMESLISEYLLEHAFIEAFSINHITCKMTLCEIQAFGYEGHEQWNAMMSQMRSNDWFREFSGTSTASNSNNGNATVVSILHRNRRNAGSE